MMKLKWNKSKGANALETAAGGDVEYVVNFSDCMDGSEAVVFNAFTQSIEKAIGFLSENVKDESMYFLFEWDVTYSMLTVVVTDDLKKNDSPYVVKCSMSGLEREMTSLKDRSEDEWKLKTAECSSNIQYHIRDFLTTSSEFCQYSLIAIFHDSSREKSELL